MMNITISDHDTTTNVLSFDLKDLLAVLGEDGELSKWTVSGTEAMGASAEELYAAQGRGERLCGTVLRRIAGGLEQVIEGESRAYEHAEDANPWLIARVVDSSSWTLHPTVTMY